MMANSTPRLDELFPWAEIDGDSPEEARLLRKTADDAREYLRQLPWCKEIISSYFGIGVGGVFVVCLFKITPARPNIEEWIWVIEGDLPSAYLGYSIAQNPAAALDTYIGGAMDWVVAVRKRESVDDLMPVNVPPTPEWADQLESRMKFLFEEILLKYYRDDLLKGLDDRISGYDHFRKRRPKK